MAAVAESQKLGDAFASFAVQGRFPEDISSLPTVSGTDLGPSIERLARAKADLETDIRRINEETKGDVSTWAQTAQSLQEDIIRSKTIANDIVRQSEAPDVSGESIQDAEERAEFLNREVQYSLQIQGVLTKLREVKQALAEAERAKIERRVLDSLRFLEQSWTALDRVGISKSCRVMKLLDHSAFDLKSSIHKAFNQIWTELVVFDMENNTLVIHSSLRDGEMNLDEAVIGLQAYKEMDERMEQLWRNLDAAVVSPRMNRTQVPSPAVRVDGNTLGLAGENNQSIEALLSDLTKVLTFLAEKLPDGLLHSLCGFMMADIVPRLIREWFMVAVPSSLTDMSEFQEVIRIAKQFCNFLQEKGYSKFSGLTDWVSKAHMAWLDKCKETALNTVRANLVKGIGTSKTVEKIEKHMVRISEGRELAASGAAPNADVADWTEDWGDDWDDDQSAKNHASTSAPRTQDGKPQPKDEEVDDWGWGDDGDEAGESSAKADNADDNDGFNEDWGWGDEDASTGTAPLKEVQKGPQRQQKNPPMSQPKGQLGGQPLTQAKNQVQMQSQAEQTKEITLKETYSISSMPDPVLSLIFAILEDGATLTRGAEEHQLVASTAPGLFGLPTFALALFRAISPYYYSLDIGGNMLLYNDAMYIAEKLSEFSDNWEKRQDITSRAKSMLRLDNDIKTLHSFANRSYAKEMSVQKTVLQDLLGGSQSLMQHDDTETSIEAGVARVRTMASSWQGILARSVWMQAIGSLADTLATRVITDVLDMNAIGQDEAYNIAKMIATATELDDLFVPSKSGSTEPEGNDIPATAQYAPGWLRLKYLSEVLQSNLNEVKFLWCESELSLYFTMEEVVDLINASFEDNARTRDTIKEIRSRPRLTRQ